MEALITTFLAAAIAEMGDKTQLLAAALAARFRKPGIVLVGIAMAALANGVIAATGGTIIGGVIIPRAVSLLLGLSLVIAGFSGFLRAKPPTSADGWRTGALLTAAGAFFLVEFGDKTQLTTAALSAQFRTPILAALGAAAGVVAANVPAVILGDKLGSVVPLRTIRTGAAALLLLVGFIVAVNALRLV